MKLPNKKLLKESYHECFPDKSFEALWESLEKGFSKIKYSKGKDETINSFLVYRDLAFNEAEILDVGTIRSERQKGLSKDLLNKLSDYESLILEVSEINTPAINLYKSIGFKILSLRKNYYSSGGSRLDAIIMQKNI